MLSSIILLVSVIIPQCLYPQEDRQIEPFFLFFNSKVHNEQEKINLQQQEQEQQSDNEVQGEVNQQQLDSTVVKDNFDIINWQSQQKEQQEVQTKSDNLNIIIKKIIQQKLEKSDKQAEIDETNEEEKDLEATEESSESQQIGTTTEGQQIQALQQYFNSRSQEEQRSTNVNFLMSDNQEQN